MNSTELNVLLSRAYDACLLGNTGQAKKIIDEVRRSFVIESSPHHAAEIMLIEGALGLYSGAIDAGCDRLRRAIVIGQYYPNTDLVQLAYGWLSLASYNGGDVMKAAEFLTLALGSGVVTSQRARLRLATTAGNLSEYAGQSASGRQWSLASRRAASAMGLTGVLSSVIFSMAVSSLDSSQLKRLNGTLSLEDGQETLRAVQSAMSYDAGAGYGAQLNLHKLALGMSYSICGYFDEALNSLRCYVSDAAGSRREDAACGLVEFALAEMAVSRKPLTAEMHAQLDRKGQQLREPLERAAWFAAMAEHHLLSGSLEVARDCERNKVLALEHRNQVSSELSALLSQNGLLVPPTDWLE